MGSKKIQCLGVEKANARANHVLVSIGHGMARSGHDMAWSCDVQGARYQHVTENRSEITTPKKSHSIQPLVAGCSIYMFFIYIFIVKKTHL